MDRFSVCGSRGCRATRGSGIPPSWTPDRSLARAARRRVKNLRALAQTRGETGSLGTAPSATQSCRCSHFGIARGLPPDFLVGFRRFQRLRARRRGGESRLGQGGGRGPRDRLASQVRWSGVLREPCTTDPCQSSGPRSVGFRDGSRQVPEYALQELLAARRPSPRHRN